MTNYLELAKQSNKLLEQKLRITTKSFMDYFYEEAERIHKADLTEEEREKQLVSLYRKEYNVVDEGHLEKLRMSIPIKIKEFEINFDNGDKATVYKLGKGSRVDFEIEGKKSSVNTEVPLSESRASELVFRIREFLK